MVNPEKQKKNLEKLIRKRGRLRRILSVLKRQRVREIESESKHAENQELSGKTHIHAFEKEEKKKT